jgi:hypothetical protein
VKDVNFAQMIQMCKKIILRCVFDLQRSSVLLLAKMNLNLSSCKGLNALMKNQRKKTEKVLNSRPTTTKTPFSIDKCPLSSAVTDFPHCLGSVEEELLFFLQPQSLLVGGDPCNKRNKKK